MNENLSSQSSQCDEMNKKNELMMKGQERERQEEKTTKRKRND